MSKMTCTSLNIHTAILITNEQTNVTSQGIKSISTEKKQGNKLISLIGKHKTRIDSTSDMDTNELRS
jgi:hypothetical protein